MDKDESFINYWEKRKSEGRLKYALKDSVQWSLFTAVFIIFYQCFVLKAEDSNHLFFSIIINVLAILIAGFIIYYYLFWTLYNNKYKKLKNKH